MSKKKNPNIYAVIIKLIGWLTIIGGVILGIRYEKILMVFTNTEFNTLMFIFIFTCGVILGVFIMGFGEIIQKLQNIDDNTCK